MGKGLLTNIELPYKEKNDDSPVVFLEGGSCVPKARKINHTISIGKYATHNTDRNSGGAGRGLKSSLSLLGIPSSCSKPPQP